MYLELNEEFMVGSVEDKKGFNLYTLLDKNFEKVVVLGKQVKGLKKGDSVSVKLNVNVTQGQKFETKKGNAYADVVKLFVSDIKKNEVAE